LRGVTRTLHAYNSILKYGKVIGAIYGKLQLRGALRLDCLAGSGDVAAAVE